MSYIYILSNDLMPGFCKIGVSDNVDRRIGEIYGSWKLYKKWEVSDKFYYETRVKHVMRDFAVSGYELFNCPLKYLEKVVKNELKKGEVINELPKNSEIFKANAKTIGNIIKEGRKSIKFTQENLAGVCNVGTRFVVDAEKGKETCEIGKVFNLLNNLGIKIYITKPI
jgi:DNA-binding transcriptional regulator YiaG